MESILTDYGNWSSYRLKKAKESLLDPRLDGDHSEELTIITYLLNHDCKICERENNGDFARVFQANKQIFEDYEDYMNYILECHDYQKTREQREEEEAFEDRLEVRPYNRLDVSYEYIMAKLDRFMDNLDDKWYDVFYNLYTERKDVIKLSKDTTETLYLPESDLWLANVEKKGSIEDYANIARIYGEGMAAKLRRKCARTRDNEVFIQAFAKAIQYLFMAKLDDFGIQREVTKFFTRDYNESVRRVNSAYDKFIIDAAVRDASSAKEVVNKLYTRYGVHVNKNQIENIYKKTVRRDIQKILADLIQRELLLTFESDQEKFIHDMNALVTSEETPAKTLEKLNIELNSIYTR